MKPAFRNIFVGLLIVLMDIEIGFDLLLDPVGYLFIAYGLSRLDKAMPLFGFGKWVALLLALLAIPAVLDPAANGLGIRVLLEQGRLPMEVSWSKIGIPGILEDFGLLLLFYTLSEGTCRLAKRHGEAALAEHMRGGWWLYFVSTAPMLLLSPFLLNFDVPGLFTLIVIFGGGSLIGQLLLALGLLRAGRDLNGIDPQRRLDVRA
ncbi:MULTISPECIES: hypothetical protein [Saccharibacillus]|uniref:hypothetical protein n=1 Tax=Saccharibacillus TaxID=456492 RepID=UPI001239F2A4|nr:hypothetical protein [Saccharibacillus sp. WB 17]MWJ31939.1 hypothetical protein [Saccharibacillus sp. WB 17]